VNKKKTLSEVIKNKGCCFQSSITDCDLCLISKKCTQLINEFGVSKENLFEETYKEAVNKFVEQFGEEDLIEVLM
jgi:hypothetical protein